MERLTEVSPELLERLRTSPDAQGRAAVASALGKDYARGALGESERQLAEQLLELLARDAAELVRQSLVEHVKDCPHLPPALARRLASDIDSVALPIIRYSRALSSEDLLAIVAQGSMARTTAVAERPELPPQVGEAIAEKGPQPSVEALLRNHTAELSERALATTLDRFGEHEEVQSLLVERPRLPLVVMERLAAVVTEDLMAELTARHGLPESIARRLAEQGREAAIVRAAHAEDRPNEFQVLAEELRRTRRLTPTLLMRALLGGEIDFFERGIAFLAGYEREEARRALGGDVESLRRLLERAKLPPALNCPIQAAYAVVRDIGPDSARRQGGRFFDLAIGRIARQCRDISPGSLERVLSELDWLCRREPFLGSSE